MMVLSKLSLPALALLALAPYALGHMEMVQPPPRQSQYNPTYKGTPDYDMTSPLETGRWPYPCRGFGKGGVVQTIKAGNSLPVKIGGGAPHDGGHCQFALSYDDKTYVVLKDVFDDCLIASREYSITIPAGAPSGRATFAWAWINKTGNREYYMNCADIEVQGSPSGSITGPKLLVANLPGYVTIPEFTHGGYSGKDLFPKRPTVKVTGNGSSETNPEPSTPPKPTSTKPAPSSTDSAKPTPTKPAASDKPTVTSNPVPTEPSKPGNKPGRCSGFETKCVSPGQSREFKVCTNGYEYTQRCAPGTVCRGGVNQMYCDY
ncbi:hypothetical protein K493DRAFT_320146 [Basidiobolus meristosporus CBS 931.73]|uniref:Chitin-binding type-4 domain-containing protein n=1 Tax=Basidiobolus meristosporus CBS 931.73 TaxID=1314790 RepID=A0A1Y1XEQ1_9FUNG|nr:hypothetical protein K493DRAFT_320145 [Basidiobolus meristosporus CBS 931.73]ORX84216.1 hypothetical protein K493DRAFT_320146 [Basidiobolus meristosporus CBS 931.73]|eukprot:ORX84215.1 hypothetical protein K493DRAFT_320145 [Basidiobolus meristosporus CBS 931.73]